MSARRIRVLLAAVISVLGMVVVVSADSERLEKYISLTIVMVVVALYYALKIARKGNGWSIELGFRAHIIVLGISLVAISAVGILLSDYVSCIAVVATLSFLGLSATRVWEPANPVVTMLLRDGLLTNGLTLCGAMLAITLSKVIINS